MITELWWFDIFDSFRLAQPIRLFDQFWQGFWLAYWSVLNESIEHTHDTAVCNQSLFFELEVMRGE